MQFLDDLPRIVGRAVIDKVYLVGKAMLVHHALDPSVQLGQRLGFIVQGYDYGNIHGNLIMNSEF
jgi:hypothetical protein